MIEVRNLTKCYDSFRAVDGISFTVREGEIVGFLGPNGAGKTTTIRILTCYHPATSGSASVAGFDVFTQSTQVRQNIGYLPESVPLYPELRVQEYLRFRAKLRGLDRAARESAIQRVAKRCWIEDVMRKPCGHLSKGYRQRVGLADALLHNPKVLILDEPTVGLDPTQIRETRSLIRDLAKEHTVILSSHILPEVEVTCQRIIIISRGKIVASGSVDELRQRAAGEVKYVAELRAPEGEVAEAVRGVSGVKSVQTHVLDGWTRVTVAAPGDPRDAIYRVATTKNWTLRELRRDAPSLEEFFIRAVVGDEHA